MKNREIIHDRLWNIIATHIHGEENTVEEEKELQEWLQQSLENWHLYQTLEQFYQENSGVRLDVNRAWQKNRMYFEHSKIRMRKRWYRWTACAAAVVLIAGWVICWEAGWKQTIQVSEVTQSNQTIQPGSPKATLTLASGETLDLLHGQQVIEEEKSIIRNENNTLKYSSLLSSKENALEFNVLDVPRGGEYQLILEDGTKVWVNSDTRLRYPVAFGGRERRVYLEGEAYFQVKKDSARPFIVHTEGIDITALGTEFNISRRSHSGEVTTTLVEGRVQVAPEKGNSCILKPSEQAIFRPGSETPVVRQVNTALYTSWKDGYYMFERQPLEEIMNTLSRWYDIKVLFADQDVSQLRFSGRLKRYDEINNFLAMIRLTGDVNFEINGKTIVVRKKINRK